uniref:Piwi domain-containing protein n=1 Tax=Rhabditophanes sp. KR3021 TaxID=114890 RepID=A0AC35TT03_9BILA
MLLADPSILNENTFYVAWLYAQYVLIIEAEGKIQKTLAKPTVNNPERIYDSNLNFAEKNFKATKELREHVPRALSLMELLKKLLGQNKDVDILIPTKDCFDFDEKSYKIVAKGDENIFVGGKASIKYDCSQKKIKGIALLVSILFEEAIFYTGVLRNRIAKARLAEIIELTKSGKGMELIDKNELGAYCLMYGMPYDTKNAGKDINVGMNTETKTWILNNYQTMSDSTNLWYGKFSDCTEFPINTGMATAVEKGEQVTYNILSKCYDIMKKNKSESPRWNHACAFATYLSTKNPEVLKSIIDFTPKDVIFRYAEGVKVSYDNIEKMRQYNAPLNSIDHQHYFYQSLIPYWNLITCFNPERVKVIIDKQKKVMLSDRFPVSKLLKEAFLKQNFSPRHGYLFILLTKMYQLELIGNDKGWEMCVRPVLAALKEHNINDTAKNTVIVFLDSVRGHMNLWNEKIFRVNQTEEWKQTTSTLNTIAKDGVLKNIKNVSTNVALNFVTPYCVYILNNSSFSFLLEKFKLNNVRSHVVELCHVMADYCLTSDVTAKDTEKLNKLSKDFYHCAMVFFQTPGKHSKSKSNAATAAALPRFSDLEDITKYLKEQKSLTLLINFLVALWNRTTITDKAYLEQKVPLHIFENDTKVWNIFTYQVNIFDKLLAEEKNISIDRSNLINIMKNAFKNAVLVHPHNAFWIRMFADFYTLIGEYRAAMILYLQVLLICSDGLKHNFPENAIDDAMWVKMISCSFNMKYADMAVMLSQNMKNPQLILQNLHLIYGDFMSLDCGKDYYKYLANKDLYEALTALFDKCNLASHYQACVKSYNTGLLNHNNHTSIVFAEEWRRKKIFIKYLCNFFFAVAE